MLPLLSAGGEAACGLPDCRGGQEGAVRGRGEGVFATVRSCRRRNKKSRVLGAELSGGWGFGEGVGAAVGYGGEAMRSAGGDGQEEVADAEAVAEERDARRLEKIAVLAHGSGQNEEGRGEERAGAAASVE